VAVLEQVREQAVGIPFQRPGVMMHLTRMLAVKHERLSYGYRLGHENQASGKVDICHRGHVFVEAADRFKGSSAN
jgi:hypothetical protein